MANAFSEELLSACALVPKVDLHLHLDGSLDTSFIARRAAARGIELPCGDGPGELRAWLHAQKLVARAAGNKAEAGKNWGVFDFCNRFLQTAAELEEATALLVSSLAAPPHRVRLCEVRFCPALHGEEGLTPEQATEAVVVGFARGATAAGAGAGALAVAGGVIVCALRSCEPPHGARMLALARRYLGRGVVGFDVAGDEGTYPLALLRETLRDAGAPPAVPVTVHAGEWPAERGTVANLRLALACPAVRRLGHALTLPLDAELLAQAAAADVLVECCLTGNVGAGRVAGGFEAHPIRALAAAGVSVSVNCDNLLLSGAADAAMAASPVHELARLVGRRGRGEGGGEGGGEGEGGGGGGEGGGAGEPAPRGFGVGVGFSWREARTAIMAAARHSFAFVRADGGTDEARRSAWLAGFEAELEAGIAAAEAALPL
jgi:adenosine deaminase